jgi:hypothetical protein
MTGTKILALVFGVLGVLVGAALIAGATTVLTEDRDEDGFFVSSEYTFERSSHAIVSEDVDILTDAPSWVIDRLTEPVDLRIQGTNAGGAGLFIGIAATADVESYLSGVAYDEVTSLDVDDGSIANVEYVSHQGTQLPTTPGNEAFWDVATDGEGLQTLDWSLDSGNWTVVVMNTDASAGVNADLAFGAKISNIISIAWVVMGFGLISTLGGGFLIYRGLRRSGASRTDVIDLRGDAPPIEVPQLVTPPVDKKPRAKT